MSTSDGSSAEGKAPTIAQRATEATARASRFLHLEDTKRLAAAIAEAAADELVRNHAFAELVRGRYGQLAPRKPVRTTPRTTTPRPKMTGVTLPDDDLIPIKRIEGQRITLAGPVDPYFLHEFYGAHQLRRALERHPLRKLQEASALVEERNPGTRPTKKTDKVAIVDYIVAHVTA
jgi:hypothetical protein